MIITARSNVALLKYKPFKVLVCLVTLVAFLCNTVLFDSAWAVGTPSTLTGRGVDGAGGSGSLKELNIDTFALPEYLGQIKETCKGGSGKTVVHIQDAHCNYAAQHKIAEIIEYFNKEYGVTALNLEGGAKDYDISIFTDIADKTVREKASDHFVKEGLVSGAEYFAINNPEKSSLWGIEDAKLYIDNLKIYRDSLKYKSEVDKHLGVLTYILNNLKTKIYSPELLELDKKYSQYKSGNLEFKDYLSYLATSAKGSAIDIKSFTNIYLLGQALEEEGRVDFKKANDQRDELIDKLQKKLSKKSLEELVLKTVEFKSEKIPQKEFYAYLAGKAKLVDIELSGFPDLEKYMVYISMYDAIDKMKVMEEMDKLEAALKSALYRNDEERELSKLSKNLAILKNIFNISLTREDYRYYIDNEQAFDTAGFMAFINREAPLYKIDARPDANIADLDGHREDISKFYKYSIKRDDVFVKNIKFGKDRKTAFMVTGGFHTENLCEKFKKEKISYISIMPNFRDDEGYECPYFNILSGKDNIRIKDALPSVLKNSLAPPAQLNIAVDAAARGLASAAVVAGEGTGLGLPPEPSPTLTAPVAGAGVSPSDTSPALKSEDVLYAVGSNFPFNETTRSQLIKEAIPAINEASPRAVVLNMGDKGNSPEAKKLRSVRRAMGDAYSKLSPEMKSRFDGCAINLTDIQQKGRYNRVYTSGDLDDEKAPHNYIYCMAAEVDGRINIFIDRELFMKLPVGMLAKLVFARSVGIDYGITDEGAGIDIENELMDDVLKKFGKAQKLRSFIKYMLSKGKSDPTNEEAYNKLVNMFIKIELVTSTLKIILLCGGALTALLIMFGVPASVVTGAFFVVATVAIFFGGVAREIATLVYKIKYPETPMGAIFASAWLPHFVGFLISVPIQISLVIGRKGVWSSIKAVWTLRATVTEIFKALRYTTRSAESSRVIVDNIFIIADLVEAKNKQLKEENARLIAGGEKPITSGRPIIIQGTQSLDDRFEEYKINAEKGQAYIFIGTAGGYARMVKHLSGVPNIYVFNLKECREYLKYLELRSKEREEKEADTAEKEAKRVEEEAEMSKGVIVSLDTFINEERLLVPAPAVVESVSPEGTSPSVLRRAILGGLAMLTGLTLISGKASANIVVDGLPPERAAALTTAIEASRMILTWQIQSNDPAVIKLSATANKIFNETGTRITVTIGDVNALLRQKAKAQGETYLADMMSRGEARAAIFQKSPTDYLLVYDESMVKDGIAGLTAGLAHELVGHMSLTEAGIKDLSPLEEEALVFRLEIRYLEASLSDPDLLAKFQGSAMSIIRAIKEQIDGEKRRLSIIEGKIGSMAKVEKAEAAIVKGAPSGMPMWGRITASISVFLAVAAITWMLVMRAAKKKLASSIKKKAPGAKEIARALKKKADEGKGSSKGDRGRVRLGMVPTISGAFIGVLLSAALGGVIWPISLGIAIGVFVDLLSSRSSSRSVAPVARAAAKVPSAAKKVMSRPATSVPGMWGKAQLEDLPGHLERVCFKKIEDSNTYLYSRNRLMETVGMMVSMLDSAELIYLLGRWSSVKAPAGETELKKKITKLLNDRLLSFDSPESRLINVVLSGDGTDNPAAAARAVLDEYERSGGSPEDLLNNYSAYPAGELNMTQLSNYAVILARSRNASPRKPGIDPITRDATLQSSAYRKS